MLGYSSSSNSAVSSTKLSRVEGMSVHNDTIVDGIKEKREKFTQKLALIKLNMDYITLIEKEFRNKKVEIPKSMPVELEEQLDFYFQVGVLENIAILINSVVIQVIKLFAEIKIILIKILLDTAVQAGYWEQYIYMKNERDKIMTEFNELKYKVLKTLYNMSI